MTQIEYSLGQEVSIAGIANEIDADSLYDKCMALARNLMVELAA